MKKLRFKVLIFAAVLTFFGFSQVFGADRSPINVNLIIDGSSAFTDVKANVTTWMTGRLDQILADGDRVTVWSAGPEAKVVYTGTMSAAADREAVKKIVRDLAGSGTQADFSGALRGAANLQASGYSYTLLVCASNSALSNLLSGPQSGLMRFSRVEDFSGWKAIVVGLNIDARVRRSAAAFFQ